MRASRLLLCLTLLGAALSAGAEQRPLRDVVDYPMHSASATALSLNSATLSSRLQAAVETVHVQVSQRVSKGDVLVTLDCADYRLQQQLAEARVRSSRARLTLAASQRERTEQLLQKQLTSQEVVDTSVAEAVAREAELDEAKIGLSQAALDVSRCRVTAPFDGIVTARNVAEGQLASVGTALLTLVETDRMELSARIDPMDVSLLAKSSELYFEFGENKLPVAIAYLGGVIDSTTRNQEVRFVFLNQSPPPGAAGKLQWRDPRAFIPAQYIVKRDGFYGVFIASGDKIRFEVLKDATPGRATPSELSLDSEIVIDGLGTLQDGDSLTSAVVP